MGCRKWIDFEDVNRRALALLPYIVREWLPDGRQIGAEWVARNPLRPDRNLGSFKINLHTGRWADFATGDRGRDVISLAGYLWSLRRLEAARWLQSAMGDHHG